MFERALVAMDLSPATEALVSAIPALRDLGTEEISLVHVARPMEYPISRSLREVEEVRTRLKGLGDYLEEEGFRVTVDVRTGAPASEVVRMAEERRPSFIKVGSRSHTRIHEAFIGSVAWEIVRRSDRPVLLQRIEPNRPDPEGALISRESGLPDRVIYPSDFSQTARRAFPWVEELARRGTGSFTLLHALGNGTGVPREDARKKLEELGTRLEGLGADEIQIEVRTGSASEMVLASGGRSPHGMVVMGTHGRGFLPEVVLGSESRQVVRRSSAAVLLVPAEEDGGA